MLKSMNLLNFALVRRLRVGFEPGLNIVTGETGSGKSLLREALTLVAGGRASPDFLRSGEARAYVEAIFDRPTHDALMRICAESGIDVSDDELLVRREIAANGKGRTFINDQLATVTTLRRIRPFLIDIHGQGEQQTLVESGAQRDALDAFAGADDAARTVMRIFQDLREVRRKLAETERSEAERLRRADVLRFQREEIERAQIQSDEDAVLERERLRLANAERLAELASGGYDLLYESESSVLAVLSAAVRRIEDLAELDDAVAEYVETLRAARYGLEDAAYFLRSYAERVVVSPERLREVERRLAELDRLKRKYGPSLDDVTRTFRAAAAELDENEAFDARVETLTAEARRLADEYATEAARLSRLRTEGARAFERAVLEEVRRLAMEDARFVVEVRGGERRGDESRWTAHGFDEVEFLFSSNPGEPPRSLSRAASGGELSRVMLAVKSTLSPTDIPRTMVFDEVDAGIGGRVAEAVGVRLKRLSRRQQVLCITHQPHIARFGAMHCKVSKTVRNGRTQTEILRLADEERIEELARMMGGATVTELTRRAARELLAETDG
jgi:DNA repair protein RecN (Recombination protein N)